MNFWNHLLTYPSLPSSHLLYLRLPPDRPLCLSEAYVYINLLFVYVDGRNEIFRVFFPSRTLWMFSIINPVARAKPIGRKRISGRDVPASRVSWRSLSFSPVHVCRWHTTRQNSIKTLRVFDAVAWMGGGRRKEKFLFRVSFSTLFSSCFPPQDTPYHVYIRGSVLMRLRAFVGVRGGVPSSYGG